VGLVVLAGDLPGLVGCVITKEKVSQLCRMLEKQSVVNLSDSIATAGWACKKPLISALLAN